VDGREGTEKERSLFKTVLQIHENRASMRKVVERLTLTIKNVEERAGSKEGCVLRATVGHT